MNKLERITVTMPQEMAAKLRAAVDRGDYATTSEVVREALRDWDSEQQRRHDENSRIKAILDEARRGPSYQAEEVFGRVRQRVADVIAQSSAENAE